MLSSWDFKESRFTWSAFPRSISPKDSIFSFNFLNPFSNSAIIPFKFVSSNFKASLYTLSISAISPFTFVSIRLQAFSITLTASSNNFSTAFINGPNKSGPVSFVKSKLISSFEGSCDTSPGSRISPRVGCLSNIFLTCAESLP